ncbi:polysaccharide pyruvyl transferase family protein [Fibrobacter sp. UWB11]|uniref:polysaccharide pyruvyl transferase family protein n=1 Tax=Fibrobacter sp. UWB11 TaxID=1896202 RepID=UPI0015880430|nr:polysaccharide pyruvyl transferase family protein [Fibrobacter sp. UWB11]
MNEKHKIGLVTLYRENYGSILQCYSLKFFLNSLNNECDVLYLKDDENLFHLDVIKRKIRTLINIIFNPSFLRFLFFSKLGLNKRNLTKGSESKMDVFVDLFLQPKCVLSTDLKKKEWLNQYDNFVVGSDQIWNVCHIVKPFYFLQFAPRKKRIAVAVSFGISKIPWINQKNLRTALNGFDFISVREETGVEIVKKYSKANVCRVADPTFLYDADEWRDIAKNTKPIQKKYILFHFLNEPEQVAVESVKWLSEHLDLDVVAVGYWHKVLNTVDRINLKEEGPLGYASLIDNAEYILTDSFHTCLFSINFEKKFFVFSRRYVMLSQNSRIYDMLNRFALQDRLISDIENLKNKYLENLPKHVKNIIEKERADIRNFVKKSILKNS